jgi:hypothetical protein
VPDLRLTIRRPARRRRVPQTRKFSVERLRHRPAAAAVLIQATAVGAEAYLWSAICSFALGMAGQVAYHLLAPGRGGPSVRATRPITTVVACLPVLVLAMGTVLAHMLRADADTSADHGTGGPAVSRFLAWSAEDQAGVAQDQAAPPAPLAGTGPSAGTRTPAAGPRCQVGNSNLPSIGQARMAASRLTAAGRPVSRRGPAQRGNQRLQPGPERPGTINTELAATAAVPAREGTRQRR